MDSTTLKTMTIYESNGKMHALFSSFSKPGTKSLVELSNLRAHRLIELSKFTGPVPLPDYYNIEQNT